MSKFIGKKVIVRADRAGVFYGELVEKNGSDVLMKDVRKLWYWDGANSIEDLSISGTKSPEKCKFTIVVSEMEIANAIQVLPCTSEAIKSIEGVEAWTS
jgi:hypothetical protein